MSNVYYNRDELDYVTRQSINTLDSCSDKLSTLQSKCQEDMKTCSTKQREISSAQSENYALSGVLSSKRTKIEGEINAVTKKLASLRPPHMENVVFDDGSVGPMLVDPDAAKREALEAELSKLNAILDIVLSLISELESTKQMIEESSNLMEKYPQVFEKHSGEFLNQINEIQSSANSINSASSQANLIFDKIRSLKIMSPISSPYGDSLISTASVDGSVNTDNFDDFLAKFKKFTDNMTQDCEMLRKYTQSITDWDDKLRIEAEKILADIQKIIEKFILVSMQQCFKSLDVLNDCYKEYNFLNSKLIF